jgi:hypothetical protein
MALFVAFASDPRRAKAGVASNRSRRDIIACVARSGSLQEATFRVLPRGIRDGRHRMLFSGCRPGAVLRHDHVSH